MPKNKGGKNQKRKGAFKKTQSITKSNVPKKPKNKRNVIYMLDNNAMKSQQGEKLRKSRIERTIKTDPRNDKSTESATTNQQLVTVNPALTFTVPAAGFAVTAPAVSIVSYALSRGFMVQADSPDVPYQALVYLAQILLNYAANTVSSTITVPLWLNILGQSLRQKIVNSRSGKIAYKFELNTLDAEALYPTSSELTMGPTAYGHRWNCGVPSNIVFVNGFFPALDTSGLTPNLQLGAKAIEALFLFLADMTRAEGRDESLHRRVPANEVNFYTNDPSAFAVNIFNPGGGYADSGAFGKELQLEVPIRVPLLAFAKGANVLDIDPTRYPNFARAFSTDGLFAGGAVATLLERKQLQFKDPPSLHCIDFLEFADVLFRGVTLANQQMISDPDWLTSYGSDASLAADLTCPLTIQEALLCYRSAFMAIVKNTQHMVQGTYSRLPANANDNQFTPFVSGSGTCPYNGATQMLLPQLLVENMRSISYRINYGNRGGKKNAQMFIPILGQYSLDVLDREAYVATAPFNGVEGTITAHTFTAPPAIGKKIEMVKGKSVEIPLLEEPISLVDGKYSNGYCAINDPGSLSRLIEIWNEWIKRRSTYLAQLGTVGTEGGINTLTSICGTRYWRDAQEDAVKREYADQRFKRNKLKLGETPYDNRQIVAYTFNVPPYQACWETIQQTWIYPVMKMEVTSSLRSSTPLQRTGALLHEPYQMSIVSSNQPKTLTASHETYANLLAKSRQENRSEIDEFLVEEAKKGRGGILSSLGNSLLSAAAPTLMTMASNAIGMIPY